MAPIGSRHTKPAIKGYIGLLWLLLLTPAQWAKGQEVAGEQAIQQLLEAYAEMEEADQLEAQLRLWLQHPLDLNSATEEELLQIPYFDSFFVRNLLLYRSQNGGRIRSIYDLKSISGAPTNQLSLLQPFLTINPPQPQKPRLEQSIYLGAEVPLPHHKDRYEGIGYGVRYSGNLGSKHSWTLLMEQDRGEALLPLREGLTDYHSFSYQYHGEQLTLLLGDYRLRAGLGLHLGQGLSYFTRSDVTGQPPSIYTNPIRRHSSFSEIGHQRGVGLHWQVSQPLQLSLFYGIEPLDARIEERQLITLYPGTMHRTTTEKRYRHTAFRSNGGGVVTYQAAHLTLGGSLLARRYRASDCTPLLAYKWEQKRDLNISSSLFFRYLQGSWLLTGETLLADKSHNKSHNATLLSLSYAKDHFGRLTLTLRHLGTHLYTPLGQAKSFSTWPRNERGLQLLWAGELARWWTGILHLDIYQKLKDAKALYWRATARTDYRQDRQALQTRLTLYKRGSTPLRTSARIAYQYQWLPNLHLRAGANLSHTKSNPLTWAIHSRIRYQWGEGLSVEGGLQYFHTDKKGVVRADQPYLPWHYYTPMLRGEGVRATAQVRYKNRQLQCYLRSALTFYRQMPTTPLPTLLQATLTYQI